MITMTSLEAQNQFGTLLDTSQREPVMITRRGRPVSMLFSPHGDPDIVTQQFMKLMASIAPLRGQRAVAAFDQYTQNMSTVAKNEGLSEADIARMVLESEHEIR